MKPQCACPVSVHRRPFCVDRSVLILSPFVTNLCVCFHGFTILRVFVGSSGPRSIATGAHSDSRTGVPCAGTTFGRAICLIPPRWNITACQINQISAQIHLARYRAPEPLFPSDTAALETLIPYAFGMYPTQSHPWQLVFLTSPYCMRL